MAESVENVAKWIRGQLTLRELSGISAKQMSELAANAFKWVELGQLPRARTAFEGLIAMEPRTAYFWSVLAGIDLAQGFLDAAEHRATWAIALDPKDATAYVNRGEVFMRQGRLQEATQDFRKAVELDPSRRSPLTARARVLAQSILSSVQARPKGGKG